MSVLTFLDRDRSIAPAQYNRWLIPPAALAIHLAIGQAYAFSVFNIPLTRLIGHVSSLPGRDWTIKEVGWIFSIAIVFLGLSAALFGKWLERVGPRMAMFASATCFGAGFLIASVGVSQHQLWLVILGYGVVGGIGLGLGYISPVSTLIKWFPDRPGMATGMAIMGFGGGAMIGAPLGQNLMKHYLTATSMGVSETFVTMGVVYFAFMMWGVFTVRLPAPGWKPAAYVAPAAQKMVTKNNVSATEAIKTQQFWLLWGVLFLNVTAGIALLGQASNMIQEVFPKRVTPAAAAGFVGLLSIFNMAGRFLWSSISDYIGRKATYAIYFLLGAILYVLIPTSGHQGSIVLFVAACALVISMYGGGFATIPAYLRDLFGTMQVGAIHGRLLTAWSAAGIAGPYIIAALRESALSHGVDSRTAYDRTMYVMAGLLCVGFLCNALVTAVSDRHHTAHPAAQPLAA
jgi:MFS family permease